ncbi:MAG: hypothetical protein HYY02_09570 [Chloroflexi bacterium]|nr:hypothetical protein [Chloroflexota bacterium]
MSPLGAAASGWTYLTQGFTITTHNPRLFAQIVTVFSLPAMLAGLLATLLPPTQLWSILLIFLLDSTTAVVGPVVFMMAVGAAYREQVLSLRQVAARAVPWLPRYLWTNVHTSAIFWLPVGGLLAAERWLGEQILSSGGLDSLAVLFLGVLTLCLAVYLHSRTLLAPFLAVHSNLPGTRAAWESWRLSGQHLPLVVGTFIAASAPLALPLVLALGALLSNSHATATGGEMLPHLVGVAIQLVRLTLIPAAYMLYRDVCDMEWERQVLHNPPDQPAMVGLLLKATAWIPPLGPLGQGEDALWRPATPGYAEAPTGAGGEDGA